MYCPLCKAEYRTGTEQCSDCLIKLLQKREEAESVKVAVLWEGNLSRLNAISGVLLDAQIPNHITGLNPLGIKQLHKALPPWWAFTGIGSMIYTFRRERKKSESWRISVLESDYPAAKTALDNLLYGYDKTVTPTGLLEVTNSAASTEPQAKSAKWLYLELCVMLLVFIFSAIINVFLAVSDSVFPLDNKPTAPNTIVVVGMLIGMVALWRAILRREPKTNDKFRKKHLRFVSVAGAALAVLLSTAALWGYKNGDDRIKVHKIEVLLSDFTAVGQVATRVDEIRSRSMKTTKDYVDAYSEVEAPLGEWKSKVDQVSL
jgi:hypothetical protein